MKTFHKEYQTIIILNILYYLYTLRKRKQLKNKSN
jgi:hypothetical protein